MQPLTSFPYRSGGPILEHNVRHPKRPVGGPVCLFWGCRATPLSGRKRDRGPPVPSFPAGAGGRSRRCAGEGGPSRQPGPPAEVTEQKRDTGKNLVADFKAIARYFAKGPTCPEPWAALSPEHPWGCRLWLQGHHRATSRGCDKAPRSTNSRPARHALISGPAIQAGRNQTGAVSRAHDHHLL